jgi:mRNA interferase RelE/StbE
VRYRVAFTVRAEKDLAELPRQVQKRIARWLDLLADDPHREGTKKVEEQGELRRVHASKDYVIVYVIRKREVLVLIVRVAHRKEVYRGL